MSTVPASIGALREVGVEIREFSRSVVPRVHDQADSGSMLTESDPHISNSGRHRFFSGCAVRNVTRREGPTQLDSDNESPVATSVGAQPTRIS